MSLMKDLLERPFDQAITSKYTTMNGLIYLGFGAPVLIWPGMVQTIFREAAFVGNEAALIRVTGMTVMVIGWLYLFGGLCHGGSFPHLTFALLDPALGIGAWLLLSRSDRPRSHSTSGKRSL